MVASARTSGSRPVRSARLSARESWRGEETVSGVGGVGHPERPGVLC